MARWEVWAATLPTLDPREEPAVMAVLLQAEGREAMEEVRV